MKRTILLICLVLILSTSLVLANGGISSPGTGCQGGGTSGFYEEGFDLRDNFPQSTYYLIVEDILTNTIILNVNGNLYELGEGEYTTLEQNRRVYITEIFDEEVQITTRYQECGFEDEVPEFGLVAGAMLVVVLGLFLFKKRK